MDEPLWDEHERSTRRVHALCAPRPEPEHELSLEHVERIGVRQVHVRVGTAFAGAVARLRHVEQLVGGLDHDRTLLTVGDRLATTRRQEDGSHDLESKRSQ